MEVASRTGDLKQIDGPWKKLILLSGILALTNLGCESWQQQKRRAFGPNDGRPVFIPTTSQNITVDLGDRAVLKCRVEQLGAKTVTWRRQYEDHPLTIGLFTFAPDTRIAVDFNQRTDEWSLIIKDVQSSDQGLYHCQVTMKEEHDNTYDVQLNVRTVHVTGTQYVSLGGTVALQCQASLSDLPNQIHDLIWFKDDRQLRSDSAQGLLITTKQEKTTISSWLNIQRSQTSHAGLYRCLTSTLEASEFVVYIRNNVPIRLNMSHQSGVSAGRMASPLHSSSVRFPTCLEMTLTFSMTVVSVVLLSLNVALQRNRPVVVASLITIVVVALKLSEFFLLQA